MPSLDFVIDLAEKVKSQGIEYLFILPLKTQKGIDLQILFNVYDNNSKDILAEVCEKLGKELKAAKIPNSPVVPAKQIKKRKK